jgi:hypothetical protein
MDANHATSAPPMASAQIDWVDIISFAFVASAFQVLGQTIATEVKRRREAAAARASEPPKYPHPFPTADDYADTEGTADDSEAAEAATLLGVSLDAGEDEVRAALRAHLASSRLHPDQGGDGEEAKRLIAAKNLLTERARRRVQR